MPLPGVTLTSTYPSGYTFPVGTTTVIYTATDAVGHTVTKTFTVTVTDTEKPKVTCPASIVNVMLQKEVIDRIAAAPGGDAYGRLTVMLAPWFETKHLFDVGRVTRHFANGRGTVGDQSSARAHSSRRRRRFTARMAAADHNHVK